MPRRNSSSVIVLILQEPERAGHVALHDRLKQVDHAGTVGHAEHVAHAIFRNLAVRRRRTMRNRLIEQGQRIAHRTFGGARDQRQSRSADGDVLAPADRRQMRHHRSCFDPAQVETLATRANGDRHFVDFGRGEHELHMFGRLFERLQEPVERSLRKHVHFVDDEDFVARQHRLVARALDDLAHVVDAGIGGGVHLNNVDMAGFDD